MVLIRRVEQIPYFIAFFFLGIPGLTLEIAVGQAFRGGPTVAYDHVQKRLKGVGFSLVYNGYMVVLYYVPILAWVMAYFRHSFSSPLPWEGDSENFYMNSVIRNGERTAGTIVGGSVQSYTGYAGTGMVGETVGWCAFTWFLVWLCIWRGIGMTGRVVYFVSEYRITFSNLLTVVLTLFRPWVSQSSWSSS
jgi:solute carrier family 6 GABA transporter-like protein 1